MTASRTTPRPDAPALLLGGRRSRITPAAAVERRVTKTRQLRARLGEKYRKLSVELDQAQKGVDLSESGKLHVDAHRFKPAVPQVSFSGSART